MGSHLSPELLELACASPDPWAFPVPGAGGWELAALSRELLLELGAVVSRCCCSGPGLPRALSAGR